MAGKFIVVAAAVGAASAIFGAGVASAEPDLTGMTYTDAKSAIQNMGATAQVSARVGDRLSEGDCLVTGHTRSAVPPQGFPGAGSNIVRVALDCNGDVASATNPGYSAASPEGRAVIKEQQKREWLASDDGQAYCAKAEKQHPEWGQIPGCHPEG
jgi:hypothetical protein